MVKRAVEFRLNTDGVSDILKSNTQLQKLEQNAIQSALTQAQAQFLSEFGTEGKFDVKFFTTDRSSFKLAAADDKTGAILKANPGWLDKFTKSMTV